MLGRIRGSEPQMSSSYAVVWLNLRRRCPSLRTILVTGACSRGDPSAAAIELAEVAAELDAASVLVMVLDSAMRDRREPDSSNPSVTVVAALSPHQIRTALSDPSEEFRFVIVVAPAPQNNSDSIAVAGAADVAMLVATAGRTQFADAQLAAELLRHAGLPVAAALLVSSRERRTTGVMDARVRRHSSRGRRIAELRQGGLHDKPPEQVAVGNEA